MDQGQLKQEIEKILDDSHIGVMSTIRGDMPQSRYMTFQRDGLKLYTATSKHTHKVEEIESNPNTHILLGYEGEGFGDEFVEYEGEIALSQSDSLRKELWNSYMKNWFDSPDDPDYIVLEITPRRIAMLNKKGVKPKVLEL